MRYVSVVLERAGCAGARAEDRIRTGHPSVLYMSVVAVLAAAILETHQPHPGHRSVVAGVRGNLQLTTDHHPPCPQM